MSEKRTVPPLEAREARKRKRERLYILIGTVIFAALTLTEFRLTKVSTSLPFVNSIFFFGLLNVNIILLVTLVWLISRNVGKVFIERRRQVLGSRLKTKLILAFFSFSLIPTLVLFVISSLYINSSFDKWFSLKIQNTLEASLEITRTYYKNADETAMHFAQHLSKGLSAHGRQSEGALKAYLDSQRELLALDAVEYYSDPLDERILSTRESLDVQHLKGVQIPRFSLDLLDRAFAGEKVSRVQQVGSGDLLRCLVPVFSRENRKEVIGVLAVSTFIPVSLNNKVDEIASVFDDYKETNPLKYPIKTAYTLILVMMTLVIVFVAVWIGLYLARELTVPVERLVRAAKEVGAGNLDVSLTATGHDEISVLIQSFNKMTQDLKESRERLTQAGADLERRTKQLEAVLGSVGTGVISVDAQGRLTTLNQAAGLLLELTPREVLGRSFEEVLRTDSPALAEALADSLDGASADRPVRNVQWNFRKGNTTKALTASVTLLREGWGVVVTIDDVTLLVKGQREMAWREVARRIAHEIKNPLTPIKLSAQRLQRRIVHYRDREGEILKECTDTIIRHTDELKELVNEFSNFARFPEISPVPNDLNLALSEVVALFKQAHPDIVLQFVPEKNMPIFEFDRDQIKRVLINLLDNAVSALQAPPSEVTKEILKNDPSRREKRVDVLTHYNDDLKMAAILVRDNGPGMVEEVRDRVFEPYFSTKTEGTGLGLAIAKRIINDHDGFIRVHSAPGEGTEFLIELPTTIRHQADRREVLG